VIGDASRPMLAAGRVEYELAERTRGLAAGGIGLVQTLVARLGLAAAIDRRLHLFKLHLPYHESDHVLNIAYNLLAGGSRLEHLERLRTDEVYLDAVGARRIPDPTTAGDFCRRFSTTQVDDLQEVFNETRIAVWRQQPREFFTRAVLDADGTMAETGGCCKQGIGINYKRQWGYHPLVVSLAATGEPLYVVNRSGNRPSHEGAAAYLDRSIALCRRAGFQSILLRGDTDFSQTAHLDRWDDDGVTFIFGIDAMRNLYDIAEKLDDSAWQPLARRTRPSRRTADESRTPTPRTKPADVKTPIVVEREYERIVLEREHVAECEYRPTLCGRSYRLIIVWKSLGIHRGQRRLFDETKCFFYLTNDRTSTPAEIVAEANGRCQQENLIQQLKSGVGAITAPVDNLVSNGAYMVMAALAWSLKAWLSLLVPIDGRRAAVERRERDELLHMDFATFRHALILIPAQLIRSGRRRLFRLLAYNCWLAPFFRLVARLRVPLRC
jgi:hypothetical protein